jgi:argininosuccinate lyase
LTSRLLAFDGPTENVTDPITQRWEPETELAYAVSVMMNHLSTVAQNLILLSTHEFNMVRLHDRHCSGSSIMPQKRNPCSLEVIKAKASFSHGILISLISVGKGLFMGYNRDTQWTKYWIMDLVEETKPAVPVMTEVIRLLEVKRAQMGEQARGGFLGATPLMEWMAFTGRFPLRKAKMAVEKAVKYSEREGSGEVSYQSLKRALKEMGIDLPVTEKQVNQVQKPDKILSRNVSIGGVSEKRVRGNISSLLERVEANRGWLNLQIRKIEKAKRLVISMGKTLKG